MDDRWLHVLDVTLDGKSHHTMELARVPTLRRMEDAGLIYSSPRYSGRRRQRDWSITDEGIEARLTAQPAVPAETIARYATTAEKDADVFENAGTAGCLKMAADLRRQASVYRRFIQQEAGSQSQ